MNPRLRVAFVPILATTLLVAPVRPAAASQVDTTFTDIFSIFRQAFETSKTYIEQTLSGLLTPLPGDLEAVIQNALGDLGLVDPNRVRSAIAEELTTILAGDLAQSDRIYAGLETANEVDRQLTRAQVDAVLGQTGQAATRDKITWIEDTIGQVQQHADSAQTAVSTQAAIKQMAQQNARQSEILGAVQSELLQSRQDAQLTNLNLTNMSQNLDQEARARRLQELGNALDTLQISAQARLF
ncbi:hypothetical protein C7293_11010 [filamentous cyanobacterium CCT1]|uniref:hypothetical protein n=1 Tax=Nodosilinea sp. AN01ver1 TaxID=3423362 RepID=UPI000D11BA7D|nr:hypothetical protein C7293_11010 [filamentous cyanobacterium CCT1]PSN81298.1 hypothetical protein C8B47_02010 [filamentous cyanobacterium CCP4]